MKRLYEVNGKHFPNKEAAKTARGEPTKAAVPADPNVYGSKSIPAKYKHTISYGPDHWKRGGQIPGYNADGTKPAPVKRVRRTPAPEPILLDGDGVFVN